MNVGRRGTDTKRKHPCLPSPAGRARHEPVLIAVRALEVLVEDLPTAARAVALVADDETLAAALVACPPVRVQPPSLVLHPVRLQRGGELALVVERAQLRQTPMRVVGVQLRQVGKPTLTLQRSQRRRLPSRRSIALPEAAWLALCNRRSCDAYSAFTKTSRAS